jgi:hypothetical protein
MRVTGFDPAERLVEAARRALADRQPSKCRFVVGSYRELVSAVRRDVGPLREVAAAAPFDGVVLGWSSLAYVREPDERAEVLRAIRRLSPRGRVVLSVLSGSPLAPTAWRRLLARFRPGRPPAEPAVRFTPWSGFHAVARPGDGTALAHAAGYRVIWESGPDQFCVVLEPETPQATQTPVDGGADRR